MGKRLSQLNSVNTTNPEDYLLVDNDNFYESKKIKFKDINLKNFDHSEFYDKETIERNFIHKDGDKGLSQNDFTDEDKQKLDKATTEEFVNDKIESLNSEIEKALDKIIEIQEGFIDGVITFTINGVEYTALKGMTWAEWLESKYSEGSEVLISDDGSSNVQLNLDLNGDGVVNADGEYQYPHTVLVDGADYTGD